VKHLGRPASCSAADGSGGRRLPELDSIRGLAALSVVLLHFHDMWMPPEPLFPSSGMQWALFVLKPLYSGTEAVILFFLLSGLVLSFPYLGGKGQPYPKYLARRVLRIYGPYLTALAMAVAGASIWHGHPYHGIWAARMWSHPVNAAELAQHVAFLGVYEWHQLDFVIWSLVHEMRISIFFPFLFLFAGWIGSRRALLLGVLLSGLGMIVIANSADTSARYSFGMTLHYTTFFFAGIVFASNLEKLQRWWNRLESAERRLIGIGAVAAYSLDQQAAAMVLAFAGQQPWVVNGVSVASNWFAGAGAMGLMLIGLEAPPARRFLLAAPARFLGRISYSLYLVHPVVLLALTFSLPARISMGMQFPVYLCSALLVAWIFWMAVEEPFIRLSRAV